MAVTAEGYDSPTEETFEELRHVYPLTEWVQRDPDRAAKVLGKNRTKLRLPEVRIVIWPARVRHTNFQLRAIWKYCNERCWQLAPYAFNADKRPYEEYKWVVYPTKARFGGDAARTIAERPAPALPSPANAVNETGRPDNLPPPNAPRGPRGGLHRPIPHPSNVSRPAPNASNAASSYVNHIRQPASTPATHMTGQNGRSMQKGKAPLRLGAVSSGPAPRALPSQLGTTPSSVPNAQRAPDRIHPSRRPFIDTASTRNAAAPNHAFTQTHPDRARRLETPMNHWPTPESGPSRAPNSMPIRSNVPRNSKSPSQSDVGRAEQYTPTPGPSSRIKHSSAKPTLDARPSRGGNNRTPGPNESQKQVASSELGTPRLHSTGKSLPAAGTRPPVVPLSSRAAGKQPVRSDVPQVNASSSTSQARTRSQEWCQTCPKRHRGECWPLCSRCNERHIAFCRDLVCNMCDKRHIGPCRDISLATHCSACGKPKHGAVCPEIVNARARDHPLPEATAKQVQAPKRTKQTDTTTPSAPQTTSNTRSVEAAHNKAPPCEHRRRDEECESCECGCGRCYGLGKPGGKQNKDQERAAKQIKDQKKAAKQIKDQEKAAKQIKDQKKTTKQTKNQKASKKRKADDADDADEVNVKSEESSGQSMLLSQPKKKRKKEAKMSAKKKTKEKRQGPVDSKGEWYNPIPVPD